MNQNPQILTAVYDFALWLIPQTAKFPKNQRYLLGERLENSVLAVLENIVVANYQKQREADLHKANLELQKLRFLIRLSKDLKLLSVQKYEFAAKQLESIGKQLGGWIKVS